MHASSRAFPAISRLILGPKTVKILNKMTTLLIALHCQRKNDYGMAHDGLYIMIMAQGMQWRRIYDGKESETLRRWDIVAFRAGLHITRYTI